MSKKQQCLCCLKDRFVFEFDDKEHGTKDEKLKICRICKKEQKKLTYFRLLNHELAEMNIIAKTLKISRTRYVQALHRVFMDDVEFRKGIYYKLPGLIKRGYV